MQISKLLELEDKKVLIEGKKKKLIHKELSKKRMNQVNFDDSSLKKGYIEKTKLIAKKKYEVTSEKARSIPIEIQDNANPNTYLENNQIYRTILERTRKYISFTSEDNEKIKNTMMALKAFADEHFQRTAHLRLYFESAIDCGDTVRPFQLDLPQTKSTRNKNSLRAVVVVSSLKAAEKNGNFKQLTDGTIQLKELSQFVQDWKKDKNFKKQVHRERVVVLCEWEIFRQKNRFMEGVVNSGVVVFPIDSRKVPFKLQSRCGGYSQYIEFMAGQQYALVKSGAEHSLHLDLLPAAQMGENLKEATWQFVAKLIERNKNKGTRLLRADIKTNSSLSFTLYQSPTAAQNH